MNSLKENISFINNRFNNVSLKKHFHEEYSFSLIYDGKHFYENDKDRFNLSTGMIQVVNPYEFHSTYNSSWSYLNLMIKKELIQSIVKSMDQKSTNFHIKFDHVIKDQQALNLFYTLYKMIEDGDKDHIDLESYLFEFFTYILKNYSSQNLNDELSIFNSKKKIKKALEYMNDYENKDEMNLLDISKYIGITKYHFIKEFKKYMGITPNQYLQIKKINLSKELLQKDISLSHIAYECGFNDQSYMIKVFKSIYGYTPNKLNKL